MLQLNQDKEQLTAWLAESRSIASKIASTTKAADTLCTVEELLLSMDSDSTKIAIVGAPNTGKSSLINKLVGRQLLPTSVLPDDTVAYIQSSEGLNDEGFILRNSGGIRRPLEAFSKDIPSSISNPIEFSLDDEWLRRHRVCLIEMPPLNVGDKATETELVLFTHTADCLLLITDASAPMRRNENNLLEMSAQQGIPTVIVINKIDRLLAEEHDTTVDYVRKFAKACDERTSVVTFSNRTDTTQQNIQQLRETVEPVIANTDISVIRVKKTAYVLSIALDEIITEIKTKLESPISAKQNADIQQKQNDIDIQTLEWQRIKQKLNARRRKVDETLKAQLQSNHASILDGLLYELDSTEDFREWWRRDFTARLAQEIQKTSEQVTATINQQAISDIEWLQAAAHKQFDFPLEDFDQPNTEVNTVPVPQKSLVVSDGNTWDIISRIGSAAAAVLASVLSKRVGHKNAELAASVVTGIATEHLIAQSSSQERAKIRAELSETIRKVERAYILESTRQLEDSYGQIVADLQHQQSKWQQAQATAIKEAKHGNGQTIEELQQQLTQTQQIRSAISTIL